MDLFHSLWMKPCKLAENAQTIFEISSGKLTLLKNTFIVKNLTDFGKTVETGMDPHLSIINLIASSLCHWPVQFRYMPQLCHVGGQVTVNRCNNNIILFCLSFLFIL